jgi:hypothetical protein
MARPHKLAQSHTTITTRLLPSRVAEISKSVGEQTKGDVLIGVNNVRFEGAEKGHTKFSIRALGNRLELMTFHLAIDVHGAGSAATTRIDTYKTRQPTMFGFIPTGPKRISAYKTYRRFMEKLGLAILEEDPAARVTLTERVS